MTFGHTSVPHFDIHMHFVCYILLVCSIRPVAGDWYADIDHLHLQQDDLQPRNPPGRSGILRRPRSQPAPLFDENRLATQGMRIRWLSRALPVFGPVLRPSLDTLVTWECPNMRLMYPRLVRRAVTMGLPKDPQDDLYWINHDTDKIEASKRRHDPGQGERDRDTRRTVLQQAFRHPESRILPEEQEGEIDVGHWVVQDEPDAEQAIRRVWRRPQVEQDEQDEWDEVAAGGSSSTGRSRRRIT
jgi:hypothetical protein